MRRISKITQRILSQNRGRDVERLTLKLKRMRTDPFALFRGTNALFLEFLPRGHALFRAPSTLVCGDLHLENFGAFKGDNRLCYFDINDFDEACVAPFTVDIVRFIAAVKVAAPGLGLGRAQAARLVTVFLDTYRRAIDEGKPRWLERSLASGVVRVLLRRAMQRSRRELLDRLSRAKGGTRRIRIGERALDIDEADLKRLQRFATTLGRRASLSPASMTESAGGKRSLSGQKFFELVDAARRVAGCGSLGLERYVLLVRGRGSPDENFVLDLKFAAPSAVAQWMQRRQPAWATDAARVVEVQKVMQAISPAMLEPLAYETRPFVLKELQPSIDRLALAAWKKKPNRIFQSVEAMGAVTAWAHLRGCRHRGAATVEALQSFVAGNRWTGAAERIAESAARRIDAAWKTYAKDYDAGPLV